MNPILLITLEYPPEIGGIATYLSKMVECFPESSIQVLAQPAGPDREREAHAEDMASRVPIYRRTLVSDWIRPRWLPSVFETERVCRREGPPSAVIVSHILPLGLAALRLKRLRGVPYCVILHGMDAALALSAGGRKRRQAASIVRSAGLVVVNSRFTAQLAKTLGTDESKTIVVHPSAGFSMDERTVPEEAAADFRRRFGLGDSFTVMSAGRLVRRKGFDDVILALSRLKAKGRDFRHLIVGDGPDRRRLEKLAEERGLAGQTVFAGSLSREDMKAAFASSDIFVMAPKSIGPDIEGFGIVYLEANLFRKPVIGTRSGGVPDAIADGESGFLVDPGRPDELAQAIARLADDRELRHRLGQFGLDRAVSGFTWPDQCRPLTGAILRLAEGKKS